MPNVNGVQLVGAATGAGAEVQAVGSDTNIDIVLRPKGTGKVTPAGPLVPVSGVAPSHGRFSKALADADYTLLATEYPNRHLEFTGALTAGRNIVLPLIDGAEWVVYNNTTGGFALTVKGATGTGIAIAATKTAILRTNGTNFLRVTADV